MLVVDDEPDLRELVRINLSLDGHRVLQAADGDEALNLRFILENLLEVVEAAESDFEIANNGRPVTRPEGECKGRDGVERFENVTLAVHDGSAEGGIEIMLLIDAPGEKFLGLVVASFGKEALGDAVFDFAGVG